MTSGFNVIDFMDLPAVERCIVRLVLRQTTMSYPELTEAVTTMPPDQRFDQTKLDTALDHLIRSTWLLRENSDDHLVYRVNMLHSARGEQPNLPDDSAVSQQFDLNLGDNLLSMKRGGKRTLPSHVWDCLDDPAERSPEPPAQKRRTGLFDKLIDQDSPPKDK